MRIEPQDLPGKPTMHFIPFEQMTPREQAEHLVYVHGFGVKRFYGLPDHLLPDDAAVVDAFVTERITVQYGVSFPHPNGRDDWHSSDHDADEDYVYGGNPRYQHAHDKHPA